MHSNKFLVALAFLFLMAMTQPASHGQMSFEVEDIALISGLQDNEGFSTSDHLKRGRASICADFNNDGRVDMYVGNPGDESYILLNQGNDSEGIATFGAPTLLLNRDLAWGAAAADYDEDGDIDLFISIGGNEGIGLDVMFRNMLVEDGIFSMQDVTVEAGVAGPQVNDFFPNPQASANAMFVDYDCDGDLDLWVNTNAESRDNNVLWENQLRESGEAIFVDVTDAAGLIVISPVRTFHSSWSDFDQDGDIDLFENNFRSQNRYMKNMLSETGVANFIDATLSASLPGENLGFPRTSFGSAVLDFNGDGFDDIFANFRFRENPGDEPDESPYGNGHAIFINDGTGKFKNQTSDVIKTGFPAEGGVMGFMVGDLNGDSYPEIFLGQGGPMIRQENRLFVSDGTLNSDDFPNYVDRSDAINFPAPESTSYPSEYYPEYPYRTHGTTFVDTNGDGNLEIYVANGGRVADEDTVRDPNRHFLLDWGPRNHFVVRLNGDGIHVNRDGIGARMILTVRDSVDSETRQIFRTIRGGNAFSAQNDIRSINFGLGNAEIIEELRIIWSDGTVQTLTSSLQVNSKRNVVFVNSETKLGDVNLDGEVNLIDITPLVNLLLSGGYRLQADANADGALNLLDVGPFVRILTNSN